MKYLIHDTKKNEWIGFKTPDEVCVFMWGRELDQFVFYKRMEIRDNRKGIIIKYRRVLITSNREDSLLRELSYT